MGKYNAIHEDPSFQGKVCYLILAYVGLWHMLTGSKEMHNNTLHFVMIESFKLSSPLPIHCEMVAPCTILPSVNFIRLVI